jgi:hypothetical protein
MITLTNLYITLQKQCLSCFKALLQLFTWYTSVREGSQQADTRVADNGHMTTAQKAM